MSEFEASRHSAAASMQNRPGESSQRPPPLALPLRRDWDASLTKSPGALAVPVGSVALASPGAVSPGAVPLGSVKGGSVVTFSQSVADTEGSLLSLQSQLSKQRRLPALISQASQA